MKHILLLTLLVMIAFAGNSIIARMALGSDSIGPLSFTVIRLLSGALVLALLVSPKRAIASGSWAGAIYLSAYNVFFSYAYLSLGAGTGALILFGIVQIVMIGSGIRHGERLSPVQWMGTGLACLGLVILLRPGADSSPSFHGALMMALSGLGWAMYSLHGRHVESPTLATAGNFVRASMIVLLVSIPLMLFRPDSYPDAKGIALAITSGSITSGLGYVLWYKVVRHLPAIRASVAQLSVPAIAALGGLILLNEAVTVRLLVTTVMVLGGVAIATMWQTRDVAKD